MEEKNFNMSMTAYEKVVTVEYTHPDVSSSDVMEAIVGCMRALTWSDDQILTMCIDYIKEYGNYSVIKND
jgi:hypothetical protein